MDASDVAPPTAPPSAAEHNTATATEAADPPASGPPPRPPLKLRQATRRDDGIWIDDDGAPLPVSASDLERHTYCPLSWYLDRAGFEAEGDAVATGQELHAAVAAQMATMASRERRYRREMIIWSWWFTILVAFCLDAIAFFFADEQLLQEEWMSQISRYLVMLGIVWTVLVVLMLLLPWRRLLGWESDARAALEDEFGNLGGEALPSHFEPEGFRGGWVRAGRVEAWLGLGVITIGMHALAIWWAQDRNLATFLLLVVATVWTIAASFQLRRALQAWNDASEARDDLGLEAGDEVSYSDDEVTADLLVDGHSGLRGRPDQVMRIDGGYVPVELKTGKVPNRPHESHQMQLSAYLRLVEQVTGERPGYGILRYGKEHLFTVPWDAETEGRLWARLATVQESMVTGEAHRDHDRPGKCAHCSRLAACPERLVEPKGA